MADENAALKNDDTSKMQPPASRSPNETGGPRATEKDPLMDLLQRMERVLPSIADTDREFAKELTLLTKQSADPERAAQPGFRHEVAYALQDLEKYTNGRLDLQPALRSEMTALAGSAPGLENERMLSLMRQTGAVTDRALVQEVRLAAWDIARTTSQETPTNVSRMDAIENRLRLAPRVPEAISSTPQQEVPTAPPQATSAVSEPRGDARSALPTEGSAGPQAAQANETRVDGRATQQGPGPQGSQPIMMAATPLDRVFAALRPAEKVTGAPWDPSPTPMRDRLSAFEKTMQTGADDQTMQRAEKLGRAALEALQGFNTGEGATVMNRIREAARSEPGGMAAVLSEMRQGGRFADLRGQFNNAVFNERSLSASYDRAASALASYGANRPAAEQILAHRPDATNISNKFEQMDAAIGEAASNIPSRKDGKAMIDDLAKMASELLHRAVDAVKSVFAPTPEVGARPSSPAP